MKIHNIPVITDELVAVALLKDKKTITRYEYGDSMSPILLSGEFALITPINDINELDIGDAVFCNVNGILMTHMILAKDKVNGFLISSTDGYEFGWTHEIFGKAESWKKIYGKRIFINDIKI